MVYTHHAQMRLLGISSRGDLPLQHQEQNYKDLYQKRAIELCLAGLTGTQGLCRSRQLVDTLHAARAAANLLIP